MKSTIEKKTIELIFFILLEIETIGNNYLTNRN